MAYIPPAGDRIAFGWDGAGEYTPPDGGQLIFNFSNAPVDVSLIGPLGFAATQYGLATLHRTLSANGFVASRFGATRLFRGGDYIPSNPIDFSWQSAPGGYIAPYAGAVVFRWGGRSLLGEIFASGWLSGSIGALSIELSADALVPVGFSSQQFGTASIANARKVVSPTGFNAQSFGTAHAWNLRQYMAAQSWASVRFGVAFFGGGVKFVEPAGFTALGIGTPIVINTTANQAVRPVGIDALSLGAARVSPQIARPTGIHSSAYGTPLVQRNPSPAGWQSSRFGTPFIYDKSRYIRPSGIFQSDAGFPRVADKAKRILHVASPVSSVFGDTALRLVNARVRAHGFDGSECSPWAEVRNRNRFLEPLSIAAGSMGSVSLWQTPSFTPHGFVASRWGTHDVGWRVRRLYPAGIPALVAAVPAPSLWQTPALQPQGISAPSVPGPMVQNARRYLEASGSPMALYGKPMVGYRYRHVAPDGYAGSAHGTPRLEHRDRVLLVQSFTHVAYGVPLLTMARRFLEPIGIKPVEYGANHMVGGTRYVRPIGYEATRWGSRIIPEAQVLAPLGFAGIFGWPTLENKNQHVAPVSIRLYAEPQQYFGLNRVFNSRQYVSMSYDPDSDLNPPRWPQWTLIENRNKHMGATGWLAGRPGVPQVDNKARPLYPAGVPAPALPEWQKAGMVSYRVRPLRLEGLEPPYISSWSNVRNVARLLKPGGLVATQFGVAKLENRSREFNRIGGFDSAWFGYPFIAPRVRELSFESRYTIAPPRIDLPKVQLHSRYVEPRGIANPEVGAAAVEIHWNRILPRWTLQNLYGFPVVKNLTPEIHARGYTMDEWGDTKVRLQWRPVAPDGTNMALFGKPVIADSRRFITVPGTNALRIGDKLTVTKTGVPPLATQFIWLDSLDPINHPNYGHGIPTPNYPESQMGRPSLQQQVVYVYGIDPAEYFGRPRITANSLRVEPGIFDLTVGEPMVSLHRRALVVRGIDARIAMGKPRMSPHTIYATTEATEQAIQNHPESKLELVRSWAEFGVPLLQNRRRVLWPGGFDTMALGRHELNNRRQYVYPKGTLMSRMGWPSLPGDTLIEFYTTISTMAMGTPAVSRPPYVGPQTVRPSGYADTRFGAHQVELLNRTVLAQGHSSMAMGTMKPGDNPFMWQGLRVGPLVPNVPQGFNAESFGGAWISHRVRGLAAEGFDSFLCEYDYRAFAQRMRVRNATTNEKVRQIVVPRCGLHHQMGTPNVQLGVHYIRPDGNADQHRKGAF